MLPTDVTSCKLLSPVILIVALQHEKEDESDDEYRSDTDVHKNLRFYFRVFIGTQAHALVGALPHVPKFCWKACMVWRRRDFETVWIFLQGVLFGLKDVLKEK